MSNKDNSIKTTINVMIFVKIEAFLYIKLFLSNGVFIRHIKFSVP